MLVVFMIISVLLEKNVSSMDRRRGMGLHRPLRKIADISIGMDERLAAAEKSKIRKFKKTRLGKRKRPGQKSK